MNFYFGCANVLDRLDRKQGSIHSNLSTIEERNRKRAAALIIETVKYKSVLMEIIQTSKILEQERRKISSSNLALLLIYDLLLGHGIEASEGPIKQAIVRHKARLHAELQKMKIKRGAKSNAELAQALDTKSANIPRYVRINTLLWTFEDAVEYIHSKGFKQGTHPFSSADLYSLDEHIPNLVLFHPSVQFQDDPAYKDGKLILQDKASCFPATILNPPTGKESKVIDATAAPGNKTTHLSALMKNSGTIYAFEKDKKRFQTLEMMVSKAGCKNIICQNMDFLLCDPLDDRYSGVTHILLDPSCSGSGILNRLDSLIELEEDDSDQQDQRLNKLATFQQMIIRHAMTFPNVKTIVYSTCSVHAAENEHVVSAVLKAKSAATFELAKAENVLPTWLRRGLQEEFGLYDANCLIRCEPGEDFTNGFFVAGFTRLTSHHDEPLSISDDHYDDVFVGMEDNRKRKRRKKK